jgi:alpha-N-acetylglucosaminidase
MMRLLNNLVGSDAHFLVGGYLAQARAWGSTPAERDSLEFDARSIITVWGGQTAAVQGGLDGYANREWNGLISGLYYPRWQQYFASLDTALAEGTSPAPIDWYSIDEAWASAHTAYPTQPHGDTYALAQQVAALAI